MGTVLIGTCNWTDHSPFYPSSFDSSKMRSHRITYYAQFFPIVEVDSTFYSLQPERNFRLWSERTPPDFVFNVKAYGEMTWHHRDENKRPVAPQAETFARFSSMVQPLRDANKLRAIHFQFPPWFGATTANRTYLESLRTYLPNDMLAVEFRHRSWLTDAEAPRTLQLLREHDMPYVIADEPQVGSGSVPPLVAVTDPRLSIVRFHGRNAKTWYIRDAATSGERFDYLYSRAELSDWAPKIHQLADEVAEVHVLTNNNRSNYAVVNAFDLADVLGVQLRSPAPLVIQEAMQLRDNEG